MYVYVFAELPNKKMNSKDKVFLGKFCILIGLENFVKREFSIKSRLAWSSTHHIVNKKINQK